MPRSSARTAVSYWPRLMPPTSNHGWRSCPRCKYCGEVWAEQYVEDAGQLRWRSKVEMPAPASQVSSPYDSAARYSTKRDISWVGYKVHLTETCDPEMPHIITNVETTPASTPDDNMVAPVHRSLEQRGLLPSEHLVDKGYTDSHVLVDSQQQHSVSIVGPVADDPSWQARSDDGFTKSQFLVDWDRQVVTCPAGNESISWLPNTWPENGMMFEARFARKDCTPCPSRSRCTRAKKEPRIIGLQAREQYEALQSARQHQTTKEFQQDYAARAGIEGTHAQAISRCGLRQCRYIGLAKTHLQHVITAAAINLVRIADWHSGFPSQDATVTLCRPADGCLTPSSNSPPVSRVAAGHRAAALSALDRREHGATLGQAGHRLLSCCAIRPVVASGCTGDRVAKSRARRMSARPRSLHSRSFMGGARAPLCWSAPLPTADELLVTAGVSSVRRSPDLATPLRRKR